MLRVLTAGSLPQAFFELKRGRREVTRPDPRFAVTDRSVPNTDRVLPMADDEAAAKTKAAPQFAVLRCNSRESGIALVNDRFRMEK